MEHGSVRVRANRPRGDDRARRGGGVEGHTGVFSPTEQRARRACVFSLVFGALLVAGSASSLPLPGFFSNLGRVVGVSLMILGSHVARPARAGGCHSGYPVAPIALFGFGYILYAVTATLAHGNVGLAIQHLIALALLGLLVHALWLCPADVLEISTVAFLSMLMVASVVAFFVVPDISVQQDRLRGVTANANTLGFYAFLAIAVFSMRSSRYAMAASLGAALILALTGSRTSLIAALCMLVLLGVGGDRVGRRVLVGIAGLACLGFLIWPDTLRPLRELLLRDTSSRDSSWDVAAQSEMLSSGFGLGVGNESSEVASTPLRAYVHGGAIALLGVLLMWTALVWLGIRANWRVTAFALAAVIHSLGEGWLLSALGPLLVAFALAFITIAAKSARGSWP